jgi:hypothetical protein
LTDENPGAKDQTADLLDVHLLDIAAHVEALLRSVRQAQEKLLSVRGRVSLSPDADPVEAFRARLTLMLRECDELRDAVQAATATAGALDAAPGGTAAS